MYKKIKIAVLLVFVLLFTVACSPTTNNGGSNDSLREVNFENDVYYSLFVRSFADSDGDGIGDLNGITENLDYLEELGVTALWLLPIFESASYHGYDTLDYFKINEDYGTMDDFQNLIDEAKKKDIKIVIDLVINHTADKHPWYKDAASSTSSQYRDYYVWESENKAYESFVGGMVDLNLKNDAVIEEVHNIVDKYLEMGVHGFRMDAAQHLFDNHGINTSQSNNIIFLSKLKHYIQTNHGQAYIVNEVYTYDDNILSDYYNTTTSMFNFYIQNELKGKIGRGDSTNLFARNLERHYNKYREVNSNFVDSPFISNHDMDRAASMGEYSDTARLKLATNVLLTLPGSPYIYYGDELAMKGHRYEGDVIAGRIVYDEYRRQPFLWGDSQKDTTWLASDGSNDATPSINDQRTDPNSMFNTYKTMIEIRKDNPALMYGNAFYQYGSGALQGYVRFYSGNGVSQAVLVLHNTTSNQVNSNVDGLELIFGNHELAPYSTTIYEIPPAQLQDYIS